ncbi:hypothetical protein QYE76_012903 [Lolium multiflorum]|uniref:Uncharacterized protein n=1 Tax=Lolium multiflorum TaxID=4521 RepID=A0AAD8TZP2_LOLMU|nr:hypothetical protein QYE76_012903 [Lolium multiflorum]
MKMAVEMARCRWRSLPGTSPSQGAEQTPVPDLGFAMAAAGRSNVDPNNVPLASLVAQEENVDVNFIKNNNFNNNAYRNNSGNNYRPYPSANGNGYGNSYGNSYNNNRSVPSGLEAMLKEFISTQTAFNKSVEEKLDKIDTIASRVDRLASDVNLLKLKVMPNNDLDNKITTTANAIQVRINENIRLMAELRARWDREENEKLAKENNVAKVWTITTTSNANSSHVATPPTINGNIIGVGNVSTPSAKRTKLPEIAKTAETACDKTAEIFSNLGNNDPIAVAHNDLDFDDCHISEVIKFLQKLAKSPNASAINLAFTKHITNALIKAREEKLKLETSIPRKLEDGWEPIIKMKFNDFECNALCDLGASISVMPKKIYDMLDLPPLKNCYLDVNLADNVKKKPLGRIDNVHITVPSWRRNPWCCAASHFATINLQRASWLLLVRLNLGFILRENLPLCASYLPLGVPNGRVHLRISVNKEGSYRLEVPIPSEFSAVDSDFSSSDKEFSSPRFIDTKASGKLAKLFSDTSFESYADSFISSDSDSVDSFNFIDKSAAIGKVFTNLYDGVTNPDKNQYSKYHQICAIEEAGRAEPETSRNGENKIPSAAASSTSVGAAARSSSICEGGHPQCSSSSSGAAVPPSSSAKPGDWTASTVTKRDEKRSRSLGLISSDEGNVIFPAAEETRAPPMKRSIGGFADEDDLLDFDDAFIEPPPKRVRSDAFRRRSFRSFGSQGAPVAQASTASSLSKGKDAPAAAAAPSPDLRGVISSLEAFASQFTSLEADKIRLQEEAKSSSSKLDGAIKKAAVARQEVDSLKEELNKLKERLKEEEARAAEKDELLRQSALALLEAANIPATALDKIPSNSPANGASTVLTAHQLTRELLDKGKGALARMHSMIFPKATQEKTLGQLIDAFAVDTKEVIEVFPVPSFVDDSSGVLPESDRIQRMRDRIAQMEKDLRSTYALAAIINKKSETAADVERYALTELHKATESLNFIALNRAEESKRIHERVNALIELSSAEEIFWREHSKASAVAQFQDRVQQVHHFFDKCYRAMRVVWKTMFPLNAVPPTLLALMSEFGNARKIRDLVRAQVFAGAKFTLALVLARYPSAGLLSIANVTGDLEALYPKVLLPANIIVDRLEKDSKVPEEKGTPQG